MINPLIMTEACGQCTTYRVLFSFELSFSITSYVIFIMVTVYVFLFRLIQRCEDVTGSKIYSAQMVMVMIMNSCLISAIFSTIALSLFGRLIIISISYKIFELLSHFYMDYHNLKTNCHAKHHLYGMTSHMWSTELVFIPLYSNHLYTGILLTMATLIVLFFDTLVQYIIFISKFVQNNINILNFYY